MCRRMASEKKTAQKAAPPHAYAHRRHIRGCAWGRVIYEVISLFSLFLLIYQYFPASRKPHKAMRFSCGYCGYLPANPPLEVWRVVFSEVFFRAHSRRYPDLGLVVAASVPNSAMRRSLSSRMMSLKSLGRCLSRRRSSQFGISAS